MTNLQEAAQLARKAAESCLDAGRDDFAARFVRLAEQIEADKPRRKLAANPDSTINPAAKLAHQAVKRGLFRDRG